MDEFLKYFKNVNDLTPEGVRKRITDVTEVTSKHLTPELKLNLFTPNCPQFKTKIDDPFPDPYWAFYWAGGQVLTRYLLDNKSIVEGKNVLDLGSGCGATAIAATKFCGASSVIANDVDPIAGVAIEMNAILNDCPSENMYIITDNLIKLDKSEYEAEGDEKEEDFDDDEDDEDNKDEKFEEPEKYDCILVGDMFFNVECGKALLKWLLNHIKKGSEVIVGDSGRFAEVFEEHADKVQEYTLPHEVMVGNCLSRPTAAVWKFRPHSS